MTWEEFCEEMERIERLVGPSTPERRWLKTFGYMFTKAGLVYDDEDDSSVEDDCYLGGAANPLLLEVWAAWGKYCETLKAEMDRCSGGGVCSRPIKVEVKG